MIVDSHMHVYSANTLAYPRKKVDVNPPPEPAEAEDYLRAACKHSIERAVFVQPLFYGTDVRYLFDVVAAHPDTFRAVIVGEYEHEVGRKLLKTQIVNRYISGARLHICADTRSNTDLLEGHDIRSSVETVAEAGKVVELHAACGQLAFVADLAAMYPRASFVIDHLAYPAPGETREDAYRSAVDRLADLPNVYAKVSGFEMKSAAGYPFEDMLSFGRCLIESLGPARCMWGSNYPYITNATDLGGAVSVAGRMLGSQGDPGREHLFARTALRLFWGEEVIT